MSAQGEKVVPPPKGRVGGGAKTKREQIMAGARQVFMEHGFEGASMDEITRISGVSKPTLYRYFPDKQHLYFEIFTRECELYASKLFPADLESLPVADSLELVARRYLDRLLSPHAQSAFRMAVGDMQLFPELAHAFYAAGPDRGVRHLGQLLSHFVERGDLEIKDVALAASQFLELCKADQFYKLVFGMIDAPEPEAVNRVVRSAVDVFLSAYAPPTKV